MTYFSGVSFYLRDQGIKRCPAGSEVSDTNECKEACTNLGIRLARGFKNGKPCFRAGNGLCKQSGNVGSKASLVCKQSGKIICLHIHLIRIKYMNVHTHLKFNTRN